MEVAEARKEGRMFPEKKGLKSLFVKQKDPKELVRKWQSSLRAEVRKVERQIRGGNGKRMWNCGCMLCCMIRG